MWKAGEIIRDRHRVTLRGNWDAPEVRVLRGPVARQAADEAEQKQRRQKPADRRHDSREGDQKAEKGCVLCAGWWLARSTEAIKIDGKLDEAAWKKAMRSPAFVDIVSGGRARLMTTVQALWDDKNLYLAFTCQDNDIWSTLKKRDDKLWTQEAVEIFIDANGDKKDYIELQINPQGAIFDSYLPSYRKNDNGWNSQMKVAVKVDGTVDKRGDKDKSWVVELALPLKDAKGKGTYELKTPTRRHGLARQLHSRGHPQKEPSSVHRLVAAARWRSPQARRIRHPALCRCRGQVAGAQKAYQSDRHAQDGGQDAAHRQAARSWAASFAKYQAHRSPQGQARQEREEVRPCRWRQQTSCGLGPPRS
jgi:hypothetical protein